VKNGSINSQSTVVDPELERSAPVAHPSYLQDVSNRQYYNSNRNQLITTTLVTTPLFSRGEMKKVIEKYEEILKAVGEKEELITSREKRLVYYHFLNNPVSTLPMAKDSTKLADTQVYRATRWLEKNNYLTVLQKIKGPQKGGPKPILYALPDYTEEERARGIIEVQKSYTPAYDVVLQLTQRIFDDFKEEEIQYMKIVELAKKHSHGLHFLDIADMTAREVHQRGKTVLNYRSP